MGKYGNYGIGPNGLYMARRKTLFSYTFAMGRKMLKIIKPKINIVKKKWARVHQPNFKFRWANIWCKQVMNNKKEVKFIWLIYNKNIVVNVEKARVNRSIN
jgi:hypothetical protein